MDFIKTKEKKTYTIINNSNNKYIISFLSHYNLIVSITDDSITFTADSIESLQTFNKNNKNNTDFFINNFIFDIGCQLLLLKESHIGIKHFNLSDIIILNNNIFLFINPNMLYKLLDKSFDKSLDKLLPQYMHGTFSLNSIDMTSIFLPPEFNNTDTKKYYYYTTSYYSFAKLLLHIFNIEIDDIENTSLYFFCKRCLIENPLDRTFNFI
jgi:hypothetical protein